METKAQKVQEGRQKDILQSNCAPSKSNETDNRLKAQKTNAQCENGVCKVDWKPSRSVA